ncbi:MAG: ubiquitin [Armatimonadota bacterium]|jgi:hypothetical protein|nr:ubiquitin [Armatimonadota bacterium]
MEDQLNKIDIIRERFSLSYEEARTALEESGGDVVSALDTLERSRGRCTDLVVLGAEIADDVRRFMDGGPIKKIRVKYGNKLVTETPVTLTALAAVAVGIAAVLISRLAIELEKS